MCITQVSCFPSASSLTCYLSLEESVKELQRKRHSATPGVSFRGRVRKVAKWQSVSDGQSDEESESKLVKS